MSTYCGAKIAFFAIVYIPFEESCTSYWKIPGQANVLLEVYMGQASVLLELYQGRPVCY